MLSYFLITFVILNLSKIVFFFVFLCYNSTMENTIVAISTPLGRGAISIIRMSGERSLDIAKKVFSSSKLDYKNIEPNKLYLGSFFLNQQTKEKCFLVYFKDPYSFTGEDMIEFQIHGGVLLSQKILNILINNGAKLANPGEFSERAFENGKISLDEAEAIIGEINAESEGELIANLNLAQGKLKQKITKMQDNLTSLIAQIEATLDYPEEDFEKSAKENIFNQIYNIKNDLLNIINQEESLKYVNKGVNIAIIGAPNVGKSSLLNALVGQDKAIVTDIAGTTRDIINEQIIYKGIKFNFIDTAGIRESNDIVEKIGIERSQKSIENADIVLCILDGSSPLNSYDEDIIKKIKDYKHIIVINKSDCPRKLQTFKNEIVISAKEEIGIEKLKQSIFDLIISKDIDLNKLMIVNERQSSILKDSYQLCKKIIEDKQQSMDIIAMQIKNLWNCLGKITGQCENENIINLIFSKFCLGK